MALGFLDRLKFWKRRLNPFSRMSRDILEFSQAFSYITDMNMLIPSVMGKIRELLEVDKAALFLRRAVSDRFDLIHSRDIELKPQLRIRKSYHFTRDDRIVRWFMTNRCPFVMSAMPGVFNFFSNEERDILRFISAEVCVPLEAHNSFIGVLCLGSKRNGKPFTELDLQLLTAIVAQAALAFENNRLQLEAIERERLKKELEIAGELQQRLLPNVPPHGYSAVDLHGFCVPCTEVGGDYYDYLPLNDKQLCLVLGDVAGHGMRSGLLMAMVKSCLVTTVQIDASCEQVMKNLNSLICGLGERRALMTFLYSYFDASDQTYTFSNAGQIYPYHYSKQDDSISTIESISYPLGVRSEYSFPMNSVRLEPGDFILTCSDGFVESQNRKMEEFGYERLEESIYNHRGKSARKLSESVKADLFTFLDGSPHEDDLTLLVLKIKE